MGDLTEHFNRTEFACKCGCGLNLIDLDLVDRLESARQILDKPIVITSGCRCAAHNVTLQNHVLDSAHLTGLAADLRCRTNAERYELLMALLTVGFPRIGLGRGYIHVDLDRTKPQETCWIV